MYTPIFSILGPDISTSWMVDTSLDSSAALARFRMTRAREELILTYANEPSPFLEELEPGAVEREKTGKERKNAEGSQISLFDFLS